MLSPLEVDRSPNEFSTVLIDPCVDATVGKSELISSLACGVRLEDCDGASEA